MLATRFIRARKSRHVDHRGDIRQRSAAVTFAMDLNTSDPTVMKRAIDMTDDELAAIASGATLHVVK